MCTLCVLGGDVGMFNIARRVFRVNSVTSKFFNGQNSCNDRAEMHVWIAFEQLL